MVEKIIKSTCYGCQTNCSGIRARVVDGVLVKVEGDPECHPSYGRLCLKGLAALQAPYNPKRLLKPVRRTNPEKGLGVDPKWKEIGWDEAFDEIVDKLKKIYKENPLKFVLCTFDYPPYWLYAPWIRAFGCHAWFAGAAYWCGNIHHFAYNGLGAFMREVDYDYCNYLILMGTQSGHIVDVMPTATAPKMAEARLRGMKLIVIDPVLTPAASKADEWIPIRPGTDLALALAMCNLLVNEIKVYDIEALRKWTNAPYLIGPDGLYVRDKKKGTPLVWNLKENCAEAFDSVLSHDMALTGVYEVDGVVCKPAFELLKEHLKKYTPEWCEPITTIAASTIRRITKELAEAAKIGATIVIEGKELPYRPAAVLTGKGAFGHAHAQHIVAATELINTLLGNYNVPGGVLGIAAYYKRRFGWPVDKDGFILSSNTYWKWCLTHYPPRKVTKPRRYDLLELCPIAPYSDTFFLSGLMNPARFKLDYKIEAMCISHCNPVMNTVNPTEVAEALKKIPFMFGFATEINEAIELCDIVLPQAHYLERYDPLANPPYKFEGVGLQPWYWLFRRPVITPPEGVKHWVEYLLEFAKRVGFWKEFIQAFNAYHELRQPLDPNREYTYLELADALMKDRYGVGIDWYEQRGTQVLLQPKSVEEAYPRPFVEGRTFVYYEHWIKAGEDVKKVVDELGIADIWDVTDYKPLPEWKPCVAFEPKGEYDLFAVNYKVPMHTFSITLNNPWLKEVSETQRWILGIQINKETAEKKGIKDGDLITVESEFGYKVKGRAVVTEGIHPECVGISGAFGKYALGEEVARGVGVHWNALVSQKDWRRFDFLSDSHDLCVRVRVYKE
jgi:anaerobic selenocysteine-containing dehydrogenase